MLRLIHAQTVSNAVLIDDIDDGLPNKTAHRLGSTADPKAYVRDGYANKPKQSCYVPLSQANRGFPLIPGYINLNETPRVTLSAGKGKIYKFQTTGKISIVSLVASDIQTPTLVSAVKGATLVLTGTTFLSVSPDVTTVYITGTGAITLTAAAIILAGGTVGATSIVIPLAAIPGVVITTSFVWVVANEKTTAVVVVT